MTGRPPGDPFHPDHRSQGMGERVHFDTAAAQPAATRQAGRGMPVRLAILLATGAIFLPLLLLAGLLGWGYVRAETERFERSVRDATVAAALQVDRDLTTTTAVLRTLATSPALQEDDLPAFHAQASAVRELLGAHVALRSPEGRQILSTFFPLGAPQPAGTSLARWDAEVLATRQPVVTGHYVGLINGVHSFAVIVPVERDGAIAFLLHATFDTTRLRDILAASHLTPEARVSLSDRDRVILARRNDHEGAVGRPSMAGKPRAEETVWRQVSRDGQEVFATLRRLPSSGWHVGVGVPVESVLAPLRRTLWTAAAIALGLVALALAGAWFFGQRLARAIGALAEHGAALEDGRPVASPRSPVREVNEVGAALATAAARHGLMVHELNHRVRNTLATVDSMVRLSARHATSVPDHEARLSARIRALGKTHVLLTGTQAEARLDEVLRSELSVHEGGVEGRILLDGPPVMLPARHVVALGMLVHELATNAAKHGALSVPEGRVEVRWGLRPAAAAGGAPRLDLIWQELGGPPVAPPLRTGFGTQLIERGIARDLRAKVASEYLAGGLRFRLSAPLGQGDGPDPAMPGPAPRPVAEATAS